jgi:RecA-family ATPase
MMSARNPTYRVSGNKRLPELQRYLAKLAAHGLSRMQLRALADAYNDALFVPPLSSEQVREAVDDARQAPSNDDRFDTMDNVTPRDVSFLWKPYLISGAVNLLEGDPGVGKTYLLCAIAAAISSGGPLPGRPHGRPGNVLFMSAEDDPETTLVRRLSRMGADLSRISFPKQYFRLEEEALSWIEAHIVEREAKLVILDPLLAYMQGGIDMNKANETRPFMSRLRELAQATGCTMIGLRHMTKADNDKAVFRGLGSVDISAAVRSIVQVGYHPERPTQRVMAHAKHNLSERGPSLLYSLADGGKEVPTIRWDGETELQASDLGRVSAPPGRPANAIKQARLFVQQFLAGGAMPKKELDAAAADTGILDTTLRRAVKELAVKEGKMLRLK